MKIIELFAGIGAPHMALKKCGINCEVVGISEIDKFADKAYHYIHGEATNFGDITKIQELPPCDFLHASSPCQSFSNAGKRNGVQGESGLIYEFYRLMDNYKNRDELPKFISFENVPELKTNFKEVYDELIKNLNDWGYNTYDGILSAHHYGNPTIRTRLFVIGIRKDIDNGGFKMPNSTVATSKCINDFVDEEDNNTKYKNVPYHDLKKGGGVWKGWLEIGVKRPTQSNRVADQNGYCPTITRSYAGVYIKAKKDLGYRLLSPHELWKISGYSEEDWAKIKNNFSSSRIDKLIGNSIALGPLEAIYTNLKPLIDN